MSLSLLSQVAVMSVNEVREASRGAPQGEWVLEAV